MVTILQTQRFNISRVLEDSVQGSAGMKPGSNKESMSESLANPSIFRVVTHFWEKPAKH